MPDVEVSTEVRTGAATLYSLVSDVTRMGEWSPETVSCSWLDGATTAAVGARFRGRNRRGPTHWSTVCTVTSAVPGARFAFSVAWGPFPISDWGYDIRELPHGIRVTESWSDRRPAWMRLASPFAMAIVDRAKHNRAGMVRTLAALKESAEAS